jgi:hypothetical protein
MKGEVTLEGYDKDAEYNLHPRRFKDWNYKSWLGGDDFLMSGKYRRPEKVKWLPTIYICNTLPTRRQLWDFDWWISNTFRYHVVDSLY